MASKITSISKNSFDNYLQARKLTSKITFNQKIKLEWFFLPRYLEKPAFFIFEASGRFNIVILNYDLRQTQY